MNPFGRKLRLRKTTVRNLHPEAAAMARGGILTQASVWPCTLIKCELGTRAEGYPGDLTPEGDK